MIPRLSFGLTGHTNTRIIFGAYALSKATQAQADQVLEILLEYGINHIDTAPAYGSAETRIGPWMQKHRQRFFLATKTRNRSYEGAWKDLRRSLDRLCVDSIDLWQMHGLTNPFGWEKAMGPGGTLEAFLEARDQGLVRFLGVTGHGTKVAAMHLRSLSHYGFDSVLLPYSYWQMQNPRYADDFMNLVEQCNAHNVALQTIKSIARKPWDKREKTYNTYFYEPLVEQDAVDKAVHWALGLEGSFVITAGDIQLVPRMLEAAVRFEESPSIAEMEAITETLGIQPIFR